MACSCTGAKPSSLRNYYLKALVVVVDPCESRGLPLSLRLSRESPAGSRRRCDLWAAGGTAEAGPRLAPQRRPGDNGDKRPRAARFPQPGTAVGAISPGSSKRREHCEAGVSGTLPPGHTPLLVPALKPPEVGKWTCRHRRCQ